MSPYHQHFQSMARYNVWATRKLLEAVAKVPEEDYRRDTGLFFQSIHGTLNHLLVTEHMLWYPRFAEGISPRHALNLEAEADREHLGERLMAGAASWEPLIAGLPVERFSGKLEYVSTKGVLTSLPFTPTLAHIFNHGTHHRGQITAGLTLMGYPCPVLDLAYMLMEESQQV